MRFQYVPPDEPVRVTVRVTALILGTVVGLVLMILGLFDAGAIVLGGSWALILLLALFDDR